MSMQEVPVYCLFGITIENCNYICEIILKNIVLRNIPYIIFYIGSNLLYNYSM